MATILALDKDNLSLELLTFLLTQDGHEVHAATNADMAFEVLRSQAIDLFVLEIALPWPDGHRICQRIRQEYRVLPLMIVSERRNEDQIVAGLMDAADDYVTKPFSPHQFLARVHALLRRSGHDGIAGPADNITLDTIKLDLRQRRATVNGTRLHLTPRELSLLNALVANRNRVLSRSELITEAWGDQLPATSKAVDVCIQRLRKKMRSSLQPGFFIRSWRGFGYSFEIPKNETGPHSPDNKTVAKAWDFVAAPVTTSPGLRIAE